MSSAVLKKVNPDLQEERKKCTFNQEEFTNWYHGGAKKVEEKRWRGENFQEIVHSLIFDPPRSPGPPLTPRIEIGN